MNYPQTSVPSHPNRHLVLGDCVHRRGDDGEFEWDVLGEVRIYITVRSKLSCTLIPGVYLPILGYHEHIIEGESYGNGSGCEGRFVHQGLFLEEFQAIFQGFSLLFDELDAL